MQEVIVHGLTFDEHLGDGITASRAANPVWIDHCTLLVDGSWFIAGDQSTFVRTDMDPLPSGDP